MVLVIDTDGYAVGDWEIVYNFLKDKDFYIVSSKIESNDDHFLVEELEFKPEDIFSVFRKEKEEEFQIPNDCFYAQSEPIKDAYVNPALLEKIKETPEEHDKRLKDVADLIINGQLKNEATFTDNPFKKAEDEFLLACDKEILDAIDKEVERLKNEEK